MSHVLAILADEFEEIEAITPIDLLRRAGATVTTAALAEGIHVTGRSGITLHADTVLSAVVNATFDCVFLPGGPGVKHLRADPRVRALALRHSTGDKWIAAICAAPLVLHDAGLLVGRRYTAHPSAAAELKAIISNETVVIDQRLITSRGAGTALPFGLSLVELLVSSATAENIRDSVCARV